MKLNAEELQATLRNFYCTENYYILTNFGNLVATDGVAWLAKNANCFWLMDEIGLAQTALAKTKWAKRLAEFQVWKLKTNLQKSNAILTCEDGDGLEVFNKSIDYTDFPLPEIEIWVENYVMLLPTEH